MIDDVFARDLRAWIRHFYAQRALLATERGYVAAQHLFDRESRFLRALAAQLMIAMIVLPWWGWAGIWGIVGSLAVLYVGSLASGLWTFRRVRGLEVTAPEHVVDADTDRALQSLPPIDVSERALLVRVMNLAALSPTPRSVAMLRQEIREARASANLGRWSFLREVAEVLNGPDGARLGALRPRPAD